MNCHTRKIVSRSNLSLVYRQLSLGFFFFFLMVLLSGEVKKDLPSLPSTPLFAAEMARSSCCLSVFLLLEATWWWEFLRLFPVFKLGIKGFAV